GRARFGCQSSCTQQKTRYRSFSYHCRDQTNRRDTWRSRNEVGQRACCSSSTRSQGDQLTARGAAWRTQLDQEQLETRRGGSSSSSAPAPSDVVEFPPQAWGGLMRRREFITLLGGAAAWPLAAWAQPADRIVRVGFFGADRGVPLGATLYQAFMDELQIHGFKNGQNLIVEFRRVEQDLRALSADAAALVRSNIDVLVTQGTEPALQAALSATRTLPIVMMAANYDPFASGYVKSMARPDGNVTGVFLRQTELAEKQTELLWQALPER